MSIFTSDYFGNIPKDRIEFFKFRLFHEKYTISLSDLFWAFTRDNDSIVMENIESPQIHEQFLSYLSPLLQEKKLKVKIRELVDVPFTKEEKIANKLPVADTFYHVVSQKDHINLSPEEAILMIREKWNQYPIDFVSIAQDKWTEWQRMQAEELRSFEEWWVLFTLPENNWII